MGKSAKVEDYAGFWAFCCKKHEIFTNPVFKNPGIYRKGILETFTRWPNSAPELLLLLLAVIFRYSTVIYTWIFENRVNESFIFFEVVLILRLSLKDTVSKLRSKEVFLFMSAVFLHLLQQLVAWKGEAKKKNKCKRKETPKEVGWFLTQKLSRNFDFCPCLRSSSLKRISKCKTWRFSRCWQHFRSSGPKNS